MTGFGSTPTTTGQGSLATNQFPISSVAVPDKANGDLTATKGGPEITDANGNKLSAPAVYIYDGENVTQGATTDAAYSGSGAGTEIAILKKLVALLSAAITVSGTVTSNAGTNTSTAFLALETGGNLASAKTDLDAINTAIGSISDVAWSGSGNGSEVAILKKIVAELAATLTVSGSVSVSSLPALPSGTNVIGHVVVDSASSVSVTSLPALPSGTNVIGHVIADSGSTTAVTSLPALPAGSNLIGNVELVDSAGTNKAAISAGGAVKVDNSAVTQPVSGTFWQTTQPVSGTVTANAGTGTMTVGQATGTNLHAVLDSGSTTAATQSGTWTVQPGNTANTTAWKVDASSTTVPVSASSLPLPTGASTAAKQPALGTAGTASTDVLSVQGIASMTPLKVDGSGVTQPVSGTFWQATQPVSGTVTANAGTNLNTSLLALEGGGNLATIVTNTNKIPSNTTSGTLQTAQSGNANGSTLNVLGMGTAAFVVNMSSFSGVVNFEGSADGTNYALIPCNQQGTNTFATSTSGVTTTSITTFVCSAAGLQLIRARTASVSAGTVTVTAEATIAPVSFGGYMLVDGVGGANLASVDSSNRLKTIVSSALPAGTNLIGSVELVDSGGANKASIDSSGNMAVKLQATTAGGSTPSHTMSASGTNATSLKPSAGLLYGYSVSNANAAARYLKFYNKATAPTVGTDAVVTTVQVPANGTAIRAYPVGLTFSTGIAWSATGGIADADTTSIGANDLSIDLDYK